MDRTSRDSSDVVGMAALLRGVATIMVSTVVSASCTPEFLGAKMQAATEICGPGEPIVPAHCTVQCARQYTKLYEHCGDMMAQLGDEMLEQLGYTGAASISLSLQGGERRR